MTQYLDQADGLPEYIPYPKFLLKMPLTATAKLIYVLLLDRYTLSKKNGWRDDDGHVYVVYTIEKLAEDAGFGQSAVKRSLNELTDAGLIRRRRRGFSSPSRITLMIPRETDFVKDRTNGKEAPAAAGSGNNEKDWLGMYESVIQPENNSMTTANPTDTKPENDPMTAANPTDTKPENDPMTAANPTLTQPENDPMTDTVSTVIQPPDEPSDSPQNDRHTADSPTPNQIIPNHVTSSHTNTAIERAYGPYENVMLTEADYNGLRTAFPDTFDECMEFVSECIRNNAAPDEPHVTLLRRVLD